MRGATMALVIVAVAAADDAAAQVVNRTSQLPASVLRRRDGPSIPSAPE